MLMWRGGYHETLDKLQPTSTRPSISIRQCGSVRDIENEGITPRRRCGGSDRQAAQIGVALSTRYVIAPKSAMLHKEKSNYANAFRNVNTQ
jgi:hypothetical protein